MKNLFIFLALVAVTASCLDNYVNEESGSLYSTFDYANSVYGEDSLYFDVKGGKVCCSSEYPYSFLSYHHKVDTDPVAFKGGFILSCLDIPESEITEGLTNNQYRVNTVRKEGYHNKFAVFCQTEDMPEKHIEFWPLSGNYASTYSIKSALVNNTVEVADSVRSVFVPGNKLVLEARGYLKGKEVGTKAEIVLADITGAKDSIVSSWTRFDLSGLGAVDNVKFSIATVPDGLDVPKVVCIDDVIANYSLTAL